MKGYRVKKIAYSITAAVMVLVLSLPTVAKAENSDVHFTTWECANEKYAEGTWQNAILSTVYITGNSMYDFYSVAFENMPFSLGDYNKYMIMADGYDIEFYGFNGDAFLLGHGGYTIDLTDTFDVLCERVVSINASVESDEIYNDYTDGYSLNTKFEGTWDKWSCYCKTDAPSWVQVEDEATKTCSTSGNGMIDTNMNLYGALEFVDVYESYITESGSEIVDLRSCSYEFCLDYIGGLTVLNQNLKYYDGENIVGGAPSFDNSLCFDTYLVELVNDPRLTGEKGVRLKYSMGEKLFDTVYGNPQWQLEMDFTITYSLAEYDNGFFSGGGVTIYDDVITMTLYSELDSYITQDGSYIFDFSKMNDSDKLLYYLFLTENVDKSNSILGGKLGQSIIDAIDGKLANSASIGLSADKYYQPNYFDVACEIRMINDDLGIKSNSSWGHVNLKTYENNSYCNQYDEETGESSPGSTSSGSNYYNVVTETDNDGNTYQNYYYYDTTNNTVTPSINTSGTLNLVHTFANSLNITGISSGGSGGSGGSSSSLIGSGDGVDITIEDDDYTDAALREDLRDGFGLLDNMNTDESSDGFLQLSAKFYEHLDGDLDDMLVFGMSSVIVIAILRMALRR